MNRKYITDYEMVESGGKMRPVYRGSYYRVDMPASLFIRAKKLILAEALVMAALFVGMGLINNDGLRHFYVGLPYAFMVIPVTFICRDAIKFLIHKNDMQRIHYEGSFLPMFSSSLAILILSVATFIGDMLYWLMSPEKNASEPLYAVCAALTAFSAFACIRQLRTVKARVREMEVIS